MSEQPTMDGTGAADVRLRTAGPDDLPAVRDFVAALSPQTRRLRFLAPLPALPAMLAWALERADPQHRFVVAEAGGAVVGLGQYAVETPGGRCELALVVDDRLQGRGLGRRLLEWLLADAHGAGLREAVLDTLSVNTAMRRLAQRCGFRLEGRPEEPELVRGRRALAV